MSFFILLQFWGGSFYLLNKFCLAVAERSGASLKLWRVRSWIFYLLGLPAWVVVLVGENNWIAAAVEAGAAPSMLMGLILARREQVGAPAWLDRVSRLFVLLGLSFSFYQNGGIHEPTQMLEIGVSMGFLLGTYYLAKNRWQGFLWLVVGNLSCAALMWTQDYLILASQQLLSLIFVGDAWRSRRLAHCHQPHS